MFRATVLALMVSVTGAAWALPPATHAYGLDNTFEDELGGPALVSLGGTLKSTDFAFSKRGGVSLTGAVNAATYSIEFRAKLALKDSVDQWYRLIDFQNRASDTGLYVESGYLNFYDVATGPMPVFTANKWADVTITRDGSSQLVTVYVNGVRQITFTDSSNLAVFVAPDGTNTIARFFQDDLAVPDEDGPGALDHVRIFDTVLTAADAKALSKGRLPPNVTTK